MLRPLLCTVLPLLITAMNGGGGPWERVGPWNIYDGKDNSGEAGTLACATSPKGNPDVIYAGGSNNGVSSGVIKSIDGGKHWTRNSNGIWDTRVHGVWVHPDDPTGDHVLLGSQSGIYESVDGAASWKFLNETNGWGTVMSFREGLIKGEPFILANSKDGILTRPRKGGVWKKIAAPGGIAPNAHLSVVTVNDNTEVFSCIGGWGGGKLYYASLDSATNATWTAITTSNNTVPACANAAVDPNDRNHFLYSKAGEYHVYESYDGGKTVKNLANHNDKGSYFVMIDYRGWLYSATQSGAFISKDKGTTWEAFHVIIHSRSGKTIDRVEHDYQRIVPDFRGDQIAFPSDQGLHIVNESSFNLTSAIGDMKNADSLSALISPNAFNRSKRNLVVNMWDWDVVASWDDGKTWANWKPTEKSPGACGEGGGGQGMGRSGRLIMFHSSRVRGVETYFWWSSLDGGHNFIRGDSLLGSAGAFDYVREYNSRSEPSGICFALFNVRTKADNNEDEVVSNEEPAFNENDRYIRGVLRKPLGAATATYLMTSTSYGQNWTWAKLPSFLQAEGLAVDPTTPTSLFAITPTCLSHSQDNGLTWTACSTAPGLKGPFSKLVIKSPKVMFLLRKGVVPLRTTDGGASWQELSAAAPLFKYGATFDGEVSWSGNTLVLKGNDKSAIGRGEYGTFVWKSVDDGDHFTDETGDLVTISPGQGVWYEKDFYFVTSGEGITVKRNFEA